MVADFMRYYTITIISHGCRFSDILHKTPNNSWLKISLDITPKPQYPKVEDLVRCYTEPQNIMVADFVTYYTRTIISRYLRLQFLWDITPLPQYLMDADLVRYYTRTTISHGCRFHEIFHQNHQVADILPQSQYLMSANF